MSNSTRNQTNEQLLRSALERILENNGDYFTDAPECAKSVARLVGAFNHADRVLRQLKNSRPHEIVVTVEGGVIQEIEYVPPGVVVKVVDFDTDGVDEEDLEDYEGAMANVTVWGEGA